MEVQEIAVGSERILVGIAGIKAEPTLSPLLEAVGELEEKYGASIAVLKAEAAFSARRLLIACEQAIERYYRKENIARKLSIEILLNVAATRQIREALEIAAAEPGDSTAVLAIVARDRSSLESLLSEALEIVGGEIDDSLLESRASFERLAELYEISREELEATYASNTAEALEKILISRTAVLYVE